MIGNKWNFWISPSGEAINTGGWVESTCGATIPCGPHTNYCNINNIKESQMEKTHLRISDPGDNWCPPRVQFAGNFPTAEQIATYRRIVMEHFDMIVKEFGSDFEDWDRQIYLSTLESFIKKIS